MAKLFSKLLGIGGSKQLKSYNRVLQSIGSLEAVMKEESDEGLLRLSTDLRRRAENGESLDHLLPEAFALVREASLRTIGLRHYDVQLIGAMALHDGCVAEMKTGEGKTLVSTAAGYLNALAGNNVHVVTVNDYLAKRDSEWMGRVYGALGLKVGLIQNGMERPERSIAYAADVTYGTNSEFGFDYLRDNTVSNADERVQRGHHFAVVDEVDSILIDEARTPLIISGMGGAAATLYTTFAIIAGRLNLDDDYVVDEKRRTVYATEEGLDKIEDMLGEEVYADATGTLANHLKQALRAQYLFTRDHDYVVVSGEVKIVDEFTGRIMEGRRFSEGLHQAIEAKEGVEIKNETHTLATVTLQNYFRLYDKLSGMTGTALTEDSEFRQIYKLPVVPIPTNRPVVRKDMPDLIYRTADAKYRAVVDEVVGRHEKGQPVLVGTASIDASERLSGMMRSRGIPHEVLNAKNPEKEARIVAQAGRVGAVTIATNMAGRGTDILLGGNFDMLKADALRRYYGVDENEASDWQIHSAEGEARYITEREGYTVRQLGGLCVIGTERHEARRIDNQLRGRSGRQGDPGESRFYLSLEDSLLRRFGAERLDKVSDMMVSKGISDDDPLEDALVSKVITAAQQEVESMHFSARKNVLEYDDVMDLQRKAIYEERNAMLDGKDMAEIVSSIVDDLAGSIIEVACPEGSPSDDWDYRLIDSWAEDMVGSNAFGASSVDHDDDPDEISYALAACLKEALHEKEAALGAEGFASACRYLILRMMDVHWVEHLTDMDHLKSGIGLRALGSRDPLVEYKQEAYAAFGDLVSSVYESFLAALLHMPTVGGGAMFDAAFTDRKGPFDPDAMVYSKPEDSVAGPGGNASSASNPLS